LTQLTKPLAWIGSLYTMQGLPAAIVMQLSVVLLQRFGYGNATITFLTGLFIVPWALKIFLSPITATYGRQSSWLVVMQCLCVAAVLFISCLIKPQVNLFLLSVAFLSLAFFSTVNDIVTDGIYITQLPDQHQRFYIGMRTIFYQVGNFICGGFALALIAWMSRYTTFAVAWRYFFILLAVVMAMLTAWHYWVFARITTPAPVQDKKSLIKTCRAIINDVRQLPHCFMLLGFIFVYTIPTAIQTKIFPLFFLDSLVRQGLAFSPNHYSVIASLGIAAMLIAIFFAGGILVKCSLKNYLIIFNLCYAASFLFFLPFICIKLSFFGVCCVYMLNYFLFGLINTGYMLLMVVSARHCAQPMVIYAVFTTLMMLSYALFGMSAGFLEVLMHYSGVFWLLTIVTGVIVLACHWLPEKLTQ